MFDEGRRERGQKMLGRLGIESRDQILTSLQQHAVTTVKASFKNLLTSRDLCSASPSAGSSPWLSMHG